MQKFSLPQQLHISADSLKPLTKYHMTVISNVYHTSQSLRSSLGAGGGDRTPLPTPPGFFRLSSTTSGLVFIFYTSFGFWHLDAFSFVFVL